METDDLLVRRTLAGDKSSEMLELPIVVMAGTALDQLEEYVRRKREARNEAPEVPAMAWQRFRSLPRAENPWITGP